MTEDLARKAMRFKDDEPRSTRIWRAAGIMALAVAAVTALSAGLYVARYGWDEATLGGQDVVGLVFYGLGGAALPVGVATILAFIGRLSGYLSRWLVWLAVASVPYYGLNIYGLLAR